MFNASYDFPSSSSLLVVDAGRESYPPGVVVDGIPWYVRDEKVLIMLEHKESSNRAQLTGLQEHVADDRKVWREPAVQSENRPYALAVPSPH